MARGKPFALQPVDERNLVRQVGVIQQAVKDVFDQLEEHRRGMLVSTVLSVPAAQALSEQLVVVYTGKGGDNLVLPPASLRGAGRGQLLLVANQGSGTATLRTSGADALNGPSSLPLGAVVALFSDGNAKWNSVLGTAVLNTRSLLSTADILLDGVASNTVDLSANRTVGLANAGAGAATYGAANDIITSITLDAKGRVTAVTTENGLITLSAGLTVTLDVTGRDVIARRPLATVGTNLVAGDFALSAAWGATPTVTVLASSKDTRGQVTITANGAGIGVNPQWIMTFKDGVYAAAPFALVKRNGGTGAATEPTWTPAAGNLTVVTPFTPVAGLTYIYAWQVIG